MCRSRRSAIALALVLAMVAPALRAAATTAPAINLTTRECFNRATERMKEAWEKYPSETQKAAREQIITDVQTTFNQDIRKCQPPKGTTMQKALDYYLESLQDMFTLFPAEKTKIARSNYVRFAGLTFKQEAERATDYTAPRTTQDMYKLLFKQVSQIAETLVQDKYKEARNDALSSMATLFSQTLTSAKIPEKGDPPTTMAENIKEARNKFPLTPKANEERNKQIISMLESAAKRAEQREIGK